MTDDRARRLAAALLADRDARRPFGAFGHVDGIAGMDAAYDVQEALTELVLSRRDSRVAGHKVGLTSERMQRMCGVDRPIFGPVPSAGVRESGATVRLADHHRLGVECEICVRLADDFPGRLTALDEISRHIAAIHAAFELIDDREADYAALDPRMLAADGGWNAGVVLGPAAPPPADLAALAGRLEIDGRATDTGSGAEVLGNPLESVVHLARHLAARGSGLKGGDIVMTGAMIPTRFPAPGETYRFAVEGIGAVEAIFA